MGICDNNKRISKQYNEGEECTRIIKIETKFSKKQIREQSSKNNIFKISNSIYRIKMPNIPNSIKGTGFLLNFPIDHEMFYFLLLNKNIITEKEIDNDIISIFNDFELNSIDIVLDKTKRYFKTIKINNIDIFVVEILIEDNISKERFLFPSDESSINCETYIPIRKDKNSYLISPIKIDENSKNNLFNTDKDNGPTVFPIFELNENVLGFYVIGNKNTEEDYCEFIFPLIDKISKDIRKKKAKGKYLEGKYVWKDGKYYVGQFKKNIPNGNGIKYYSNGNILYEGDFINGEFEGNGKYIYDDGDYFIGEYKNGQRNGKGIEYYKDGNIIYDGEYINDKSEGNGKYIWEDGSYYVGQWKNDLRNGTGTEYYSENNIKYEGEWNNDKPEGNGKYIYKNGEYYIGQFKNGLLNGKGVYYYSNNNIMYDGYFINDEREGQGKYIWEDGGYYEGNWQKGLKTGKGTKYDSDGLIIYEGDWVNDKYEGNGKLIIDENYYYIGSLKDDLPHGKGKLYNIDGEIIYEGEWVKGEYEGMGIYHYENGDYYKGQWENSLMNGEGTLFNSKGNIIYKGKWEDDEFVGK